MPKIVKTLKLPNSQQEYQINAVTLEGLTASQITTELATLKGDLSTLANKVVTVHTSTATPTSSDGEDGDLWLQLES